MNLKPKIIEDFQTLVEFMRTDVNGGYPDDVKFALDRAEVWLATYSPEEDV